ncbi:hypothetical protein L3556_16155 [Candidatus Synechococcus calcipolaris G9]|uniref:Uncharacterized protein n=1 Tax=Candidatus Synechococcus calcipolaris G9 TaxID=1497997 RepID=A0ABT6F3Z4_9SYNE|nr:hypothetical protein [Candidatus Synechococcus calcipolaris]MDG2992452.1 hypothetical protein [Candidatus Synechococcus calcipolaris G9]
MIGTLLCNAGLLHSGQIDVILTEQQIYQGMRFGEIIVLHGWLKEETIDFFADEWPLIVKATPNQPLGYYLKRAGLLSDDQINAILREQWQTSYRFGSLAVLNGWVKKETVDFLVHHLNPNALKESIRIEKTTISNGKSTLSGSKATLTGGKRTYIQLDSRNAERPVIVTDPEDLADIKDFEVDWIV